MRQLELACIFTLCGMKTEHKFLAYKSAFTLNYKANNFITASHFARQVIDLESTGVSLFVLNSGCHIILYPNAHVLYFNCRDQPFSPCAFFV